MKYSFAIAALLFVMSADSTSAISLSKDADKAPSVDDTVKAQEAKATKTPEEEKKVEEEKKEADADKAKVEEEKAVEQGKADKKAKEAMDKENAEVKVAEAKEKSDYEKEMHAIASTTDKASLSFDRKMKAAYLRDKKM